MKKKRISWILLGLSVLLTFSGCTTNEPSATPGNLSGVYQGTARGNVGSITVQVTLDNSIITAVEVLECEDVPYAVSGAAVETLPAAIVQTQSVNVDTASGATMTSIGIKTAAREALQQAGVLAQFDTEIPTQPIREGEDITTDVLVVGAGGAGVMAALNAKYPELIGEDNGLRVTLIEKLSYIGGSTMLSGGWFGALVPLGNPVNLQNEAMLEAYYASAQSRLEEGTLSDLQREALYQKLEISSTLLKNMIDTGFVTNASNAYNDPDSYSELFSWFVAEMDPSLEWTEPGIVIREYYDQMLASHDIDLRCNTAAVGLVTDNGQVVGVRVEDPASAYTIYAQKVILATGGMQNNLELMERYYPEDAGVQTYTIKGASGDAITMLEEAELEFDVVADRVMGYLGLDQRYGINEPFKTTFHRGGISTILVNQNGERFTNDGAAWGSQTMYNTIVSQPGKIAYSLIDSAHPAAAELANTELTDYVTQADSLEELAAALNLDSETLTATVEAYNEACANGTEDVWGVDPDLMVPLQSAPYYAVVVRPLVLAVYGGIVVNGDCQVVQNDGNPIENLYVVGEATYTASFAAAADALWSGAIAGNRAAAEILNP